jgi:hypothetical protein
MRGNLALGAADVMMVTCLAAGPITCDHDGEPVREIARSYNVGISTIRRATRPE